jgi:hypothetical protein
MKSPLACLTLAICATTLSTSLQLQAGTVTNNADSGPGSLRDLLAAAIDGETIDFDPGLNGATITLTNGQLLISDLEISIDASSLASGVSISGNDLSRVIAIVGSTSDVTLRNLTIRNGRVMSQNGGGVFATEGNLQMLDCVVTQCFASYNGGGVNLGVGVTATLDRCRITGNSSTSLGFGGGIFAGGAVATTIRNCVIAGNSNPFGGGISLNNCSPAIVNCTIQGNTGAGLRCESNASPQITNSIFWDNTGITGTTAAKQIQSPTGSLPVVSYSLVQGAASAASFGAGNAVNWSVANLDGQLVGNNPKFVAANEDLRLLATSPALDVGNNLANPGSLDLASALRVQNTTVDLGAYEGGFVTYAALYPTLNPTSDENHNGIPNLQEYAMGFDPSAASNPSAPPAFSMDGADHLLTVNQRSNALDLSTLVQTSTTLDNSWSTLIENVHFTLLTSTPVGTSRNQLVFRLIKADPTRFYRQVFTVRP